MGLPTNPGSYQANTRFALGFLLKLVGRLLYFFLTLLWAYAVFAVPLGS